MSGAAGDVEGCVVLSVEVIVTLGGAAVARGEAAADWGALRRQRESVNFKLRCLCQKSDDIWQIIFDNVERPVAHK